MPLFLNTHANIEDALEKSRCCVQNNLFIRHINLGNVALSGPTSISALLLHQKFAQNRFGYLLACLMYAVHSVSWCDVQTLHNERFLLVVKSTPPQHGETTTAGIAAVPVMSETTLLLVRNPSHSTQLSCTAFSNNFICSC